MNATDAQTRVLRVNAALQGERWLDAIADLQVLIAAQPAQTKLRSTLSVCWMRASILALRCSSAAMRPARVPNFAASSLTILRTMPRC